MASFVNLGLNTAEMALDGGELGLGISGVIMEIYDGIMETISNAVGFAGRVLNSVQISMQALQTVFTSLAWAGLYITAFAFITMLFVGIGDWAKGYANHLKCGANEMNQGFKNFFYVFSVLSECSWDKFINFWNGNCTRYYIVSMVFGLLYGVFVELPILLIKVIFGIDLQPIVDFIYDVFLVPIDAMFFAISGFHLIKWSDDVINECYRCKGEYTFSTGRKVTLYRTFAEWSKLYNCSGEQIFQGLGTIITTILPSGKWWAWANKRHQDGWDHNPSFF